MYEIKIPDSLVTSFFTYLGTLSWPIIVLVIVCIFRLPISKLLANLKSAKWKDLILEFDDKVPVYSPEDNRFYSVILKSPLAPSSRGRGIEANIFGLLSDEEIEQSKQKARKRLEEDTKRVGYERGKLFQLDNGKWAIAWEVEASATIGLKDTFGTTT